MGEHDHRGTFEEFARLDVSLSQLQEALGSIWQFEFNEELASLTAEPPVKPPVVVTPKHAVHALNRYISARVTARELSGWANVLLLSDNFDVIAESEEMRDRLLRTLHDLASPAINGQITKSRAIEFRTRLL